MGNDSIDNKSSIVLELCLNSSMLASTTKKPCSSLNFDPSLKLSLSDDCHHHDHGLIKKKPASDHGGLHRQDSVSVGSSLISSVASVVCVKREREVKSAESESDRVNISTTNDHQVHEDDDDDNSVHDRKKLRLTKAQSALLEEAFKHHSTLNPKQKQELARELKLRPRQVEVWFQNRRARTKLKQTEVDCEYLKKCCEALKEENTRLHKELQDLKALKLPTQPLYMQLPATTLTKCPTCERGGDTTTSANARPLITVAQKPHSFFNPFTKPSAAC